MTVSPHPHPHPFCRYVTDLLVAAVEAADPRKFGDGEFKDKRCVLIAY